MITQFNFDLAICSFLVEFANNVNNLGFAFYCVVATIEFNSTSAEAGDVGDVFTPVTCRRFSPQAHPIRGTDGAYHLVYELQLTNTKSLPATIQKLEVLAGLNWISNHHQLFPR